MYIYPENLKAKATLWLWTLRDIAIIGISMIIAVLAVAKTGIYFPLVITSVYAILTIRYEESCILDFVRYAAEFLLLKQQYYEWRAR